MLASGEAELRDQADDTRRPDADGGIHFCQPVDDHASALCAKLGHAVRYWIRRYRFCAGGSNDQRWFATRQGLVTGLLSASTATGSLIFLPFLAWLSQGGAWKSVALAVCLGCAVLMPLVAFFIPERPETCRHRRHRGPGRQTPQYSHLHAQRPERGPETVIGSAQRPDDRAPKSTPALERTAPDHNEAPHPAETRAAH